MIYYFVNDLPDGLLLQGDLAIDTEAMGLNIHRDRLCVVQIKDSGDNVYLVHFPISNFNYSCKNLKHYLTDPYVQKIFHYARFDVAIIKHYLKIDEIPNVYCTKIASRLCRTYTDSHGLRSLVFDLLKVDLKKDQQSSNWGADSLTDAQQNYAANDVLYLHSLRNILNQMLEKNGRKNIFSRYCSFINTVCDSDLAGFNEDLFRCIG
ncbi:MAG: hypothetical protein RL208_73 [Pseudomonadota bacterium]|jgi:ribonuclease D